MLVIIIFPIIYSKSICNKTTRILETVILTDISLFIFFQNYFTLFTITGFFDLLEVFC